MLQQLWATIQQGWPETWSKIPECLYPYFDVRDVLTIQNELVFKGQFLVVLAVRRNKLMAVVHRSHIGTEGCISRACDTLYWPCMATELQEYISKCDVYLAHHTGQAKEPLLQHEVVARPWSKVAADLCELDNRTLLVISDYYSNYIEVAHLNTATSRKVIKEMKAVFARYGIPDVLVTDNGPQFASAEFAVFAKTWMFKHTTSTLYHPQSNGKAENAVKTVKRLFTKSKESGQSEFLALLDWCNTPSEGISLSPARRLIGRRCKTLLPVAGTLLQPRYSTEQETRALIRNKQHQQHHYNRHAKPLHPIKPGETMHMKIPTQKTWTAGTCTGQTAPRRYDVKVGGTVYRPTAISSFMQTNHPSLTSASPSHRHHAQIFQTNRSKPNSCLTKQLAPPFPNLLNYADRNTPPETACSPKWLCYLMNSYLIKLGADRMIFVFFKLKQSVILGFLYERRDVTKLMWFTARPQELTNV